MFDLIQSVIRRLSFNQTDYLLCQKINQPVAIKQKQNQLSLSHPQGFIQEFYDTSTSLVEIYASIIYGLQSSQVKDRLLALRLLASQYADCIPAVNLVRLRLMLMKLAISHKNNFYSQLSYLRDFQKTLSASETRISQMLRHFNLIEIPENPQVLKEEHVFDPHILDSTNGTSRTFSSLIVDFFISGVVDATLVCSTIPDKESCIEACEAAHFLKMKLHLAISFDTYQDGYACRYLAILPYLHSGDRFARFYSKHQMALEKFEKSLQDRHASRLAAITRSLQGFNEHHLDNLNQHFSPDQPLYYLAPLTLQEICEHYGKNTLTHMHLGDFLYSKYEKILFNRLILLANMQKGLRWKQNKNAEWDQHILKKRYELLKHEYEHLSPATLIQRYFADLLPERLIPSSHDLGEIADTFHKFGGYIRFIPSDNLDENAYRFLFKKNGQYLDQVEIYNLCDSTNKSLDSILSFAQFVENYNTKLLQADSTARLLEPVCASYSLDGQYPPFMGFIFQKNKNQPSCAQVLPPLIASMIYHKGKPADPKTVDMSRLFHLEKKVPNRMKELGVFSPLSQFYRPVRLINPHIYFFALVLIGLSCASAVVSVPVVIGFFLLCTLYLRTLGALKTPHNIVEEEIIYEEKFSFVLFFLGLSIPLQQKIFSLFNLDWFYFVPPFLVTLLQVFCLTAVGLLSILLYAKICHTRQDSIKNPVLCFILSWPITSLSLYYMPSLKIPASVQMYMWVFILGIITTLGAFNKARCQKKEKILEEILAQFAEKSCRHCTVAVLDLLYLLPRQPAMRHYWKKLIKENPAQDKDLPEGEKISRSSSAHLRTLCLRVKEWCQDPQRYSQLLDLILSEYTPNQIDLLLPCALKNWPFFLKFVNRFT